ncbi:MAG: hypothetical protein WDM88_11410 [Galbitalea sp.]
MAGSRPGGVTLVSILAWISGVISIIGGLLALFVSFALVGWLTLILGIITVAVGVGLWRGNNLARVLATIVFVLDIANAIYTMVTAQGNSSFWSAFVGGLLALIGLIFLYTRAANKFFGR